MKNLKEIIYDENQWNIRKGNIVTFDNIYFIDTDRNKLKPSPVYEIVTTTQQLYSAREIIQTNSEKTFSWCIKYLNGYPIPIGYVLNFNKGITGIVASKEQVDEVLRYTTTKEYQKEIEDFLKKNRRLN